MSRNIGFDTGSAAEEEYEDCFDSCKKQCRLSARGGQNAVRLFDMGSHPSAVQQSAGKYTAGPGQMVRFVGAPSAEAARFAAGSAAGASRAVIAPSFMPAEGRAGIVEPIFVPDAHLARRETYKPTKNSQYAAAMSSSGSSLALRLGRD